MNKKIFTAEDKIKLEELGLEVSKRNLDHTEEYAFGVFGSNQCFCQIFFNDVG